MPNAYDRLGSFSASPSPSSSAHHISLHHNLPLSSTRPVYHGDRFIGPLPFSPANAVLYPPNVGCAPPPTTRRSIPASRTREADEVDVCIIGGGPAGLSAAIRLKQLANSAGNEDFRVLLLEKAGEIGDHIVSGNVIEPSALDELLPDWKDEANPNRFEHITPATEDRMRFLSKNKAIPIPAPPQMNNHGNYIISLNQLSKWLGERAEEVGVEVYAGFAASEVIYTPDGAVRGVATNDLGISRSGKPKDSFERGMEFHARVTLLAEGCHGSLTKQVIRKFDLRRDSQPQTYGLGLKEVWEVPQEKFEKGLVVHSMGYPLPKDTYGGGWMYHFGENLVSIGLVVGLDYPNPWLAPYGEFQKMKHHPLYSEYLEGGKCVTYAARALNEGGYQSIPKCAFPGGALIGDTAGFPERPQDQGHAHGHAVGHACRRGHLLCPQGSKRHAVDIPVRLRGQAARFEHLAGTQGSA